MWLNASKADGETRTFSAAEGQIALTFDDGPDPRFTPGILDALKAHDARATFFVVGDQAAKHPELIARIVAEGHEVANHTQTHPHVDKLDKQQLAQEIDGCLEVLGAQGVSPQWYRPPRGKTPEHQAGLVSARGMKVAMWARGFERARFNNAEELAETLVAETQEGDVVLAHDGRLDRTMTVAALPLYLSALRQRGITSVTLTELEERRHSAGSGEPFAYGWRAQPRSISAALSASCPVWSIFSPSEKYPSMVPNVTRISSSAVSRYCGSTPTTGWSSAGSPPSDLKWSSMGLTEGMSWSLVSRYSFITISSVDPEQQEQ